MYYLQNDKLAKIISKEMNNLIKKNLQNNKLLLDVNSGKLNSATHCYYFIDKNQDHIVNTVTEFKENSNGYDMEVLMTHWEYILVEDDDYGVYLHDCKVFQIGTLITDSFTASTDFLDRLWTHQGTKILKTIYVYKDEIFDNKSDLLEYVNTDLSYLKRVPVR